MLFDAASHLYKRVCPSVGPLVTLSLKMSEIENFMYRSDQEGIKSHDPPRAPALLAPGPQPRPQAPSPPMKVVSWKQVTKRLNA